MAKGDWGPGTKLRPVMVNITFDDKLDLAHVGVGYHMVLPSGLVQDGGFTWHSPGGDYAHAPDAHVAALEGVMKALLVAAADAEGVTLSGGPNQAGN